jgi:transcription initiation factor TFIID subunit 7
VKELEAGFAEMEEAATPSSQAIVDTPQVYTNGGTPDASGVQDTGDDSSGEEEDESEDEADEDEIDQQARLKDLREDIAEMERQLQAQQMALAGQTNRILQRRIRETIGRIKTELELKKSAIGEDDEA